MRGTRQASAVATALTSLPGFRSAQEIHAELRRRGRLELEDADQEARNDVDASD